jgi:hypothetical protein
LVEEKVKKPKNLVIDMIELKGTIVNKVEIKMNVTNLYNQLNEGKITKGQFLQQIRNNPLLREWITPLMSFEDTVRVLKVKKIIQEITPKVSPKQSPKLLTETVHNFNDEELEKRLDGINVEEFLRGMKCETSKSGDKKPKEAAKIVLKNLEKDPLYYLREEEGLKELPEDHFEKVTKKNLVDKKNQMKKVQKKKLNEAQFSGSPGEKPNQTTSVANNFISSNPTLRSFSENIVIQNSGSNDCILRYNHYDPLPNEAISKLQMQFNVRKEDADGDWDNQRGIYYVLTLKQHKNVTQDLAQSFDKFKKNRLNELVQECFNELNEDDDEDVMCEEEVPVTQIQKGATFTLSTKLGNFNEGDQLTVIEISSELEDIRIDFTNQAGVKDHFYFDKNDTLDI